MYAQVRAERLADLDAALADRGAAMSALVERDHGVWEADFGDDPVTAALLASLVDYEVVVDADGTVLARPEHPGTAQGPLREWTGTFAVPSDDEGSPPEVVAALPAPEVRIRVAADLGPLNAQLRGLLATLAAVGVPLSGLAIVAGALLSRRIVDPITHERLREAFDRQARFTADASHELRTPLSVIRATTEVALRREREPSDYREALGAVLDAATRMEDTVESLMVLARADAGAPVSDTVDLVEVARAAISGVPSGAVPVRLDASAATVHGDARSLEILVRNLLTNAVRHTAEGEVVVRVRAFGERAVIEVVDTGEGIDAEALPHVFERFWRADASRSRDRGGSGLGLSIVAAIAAQHGGTVGATSSVGKGTTVTVTLPETG